ncbi:MAG: universal stress protein [Desulfovibrionaceae bacterium]|nr:universal stress protein [Desulfovibrionaceae bacterium]
MALTKILCAVDLEEGSAQVCAFASELAQALHSQIVLCHVTDSLQTLQKKPGLKDVTVGANGSIATKEGESPLSALQKAHFGTLPVETHLLVGDAPEKIASLAKSTGCDFIVTGSPRTGLSAVMRPSVGRRIQRLSGLPVTMVGSAVCDSILNVAAPLSGLAW